MKNENIVISIIAIITIVVLAVLFTSFNTNTNNTVLSVNDLLANSPESRGNADSPIKLIDFSDYQCPSCAAYNRSVTDTLLSDFGDQVGFYHRHFPLVSIHPNALQAAEASVAAGKQGQFWEYNDLLYVNQSEWGGANNPTENFLALADQIGVDRDQFETDMKSSDARSKVKVDMDAARALRLSGTPSIFLINENADNEEDKIFRFDRPDINLIRDRLNDVVEVKVEEASFEISDELSNDVLSLVNNFDGVNFDTTENPVNLAIEDAMQEFKISNTSNTEIININQETWQDIDLGCNIEQGDTEDVEELESDGAEEVVSIPGYRVEFAIQGAGFVYHTDNDTRVVKCDT